MREILFRGKDIDGVCWHIGDLEHNGNRVPKWVEGCQVIPETVGQYTGLTDKNGTKIFEGDFVKHFFRDDKHESFDIGYIFWDKSKCRLLRTSGLDDSFPEVWNSSAEHYEVIGNIHDVGFDCDS